MFARIRPCLILHQTLLGLVVALCLLNLSSAEQSSRSAKLRWRNGDEVFGQLLPQSGERICFIAPTFSAPFALDRRQIDSLIFSEENETPALAEAPFEIFLKNGDQFRGDLVTVEQNTLTFRTPFFPDPVRLPQSQIRRIVRVSGPGRAWIGPGGLDGLISTGRDRKPLDWTEGRAGSLTTHQWLGDFFRSINLPSQVELRFRLTFPNGSPDFEVGVLHSPEYGPMLETWNHRLVLTFGNHFAPVIDLSPGVNDLTIRLFWNQETGEVRLCDMSGKTLVTVKGGKINEEANPLGRRKSPSYERGFYLLSRNTAMTLQYLHVFEWDGETITEIQPDSPRIQWRSGAAWQNPDDLKLVTGEKTMHRGTESRSLSDLIEWTFPMNLDEPSAAPTAGTVHVLWPGGISMSGRGLNISPSEAILQPDWSESPIAVKLDGAKSLHFDNPDVLIARGGDILSADSARMQGSLHLAPENSTRYIAGDSFLAWQAVGAETPVPFARNTPFTVTRSALARGSTASTGAFSQSRLHLNTDEIVTGELVSLSPDQVTFSSLITGQIQIATADWRGIDLGWTGRIFQGFRDPAWRISDGDQDQVTLAADSVTMKAGSITNPSLLLGDRIDFDISGEGGGMNLLRLRLFLSESDPTAPSTDIDFSIRGKNLTIGRITDASGRSFSGRDGKMDEKHNHVTAFIRPTQIEVFLNGKFVADFPNKPSFRSGNGIRFQKYLVDGPQNSTLRLGHFQITSQSGSLIDPILDSRAARDLFTIPRSQKEKPPSHLLIGTNGDILRGSLESIHQNEISFEANGKMLLLPRSRIASLMRSDPPLPAQEPRAQATYPLPAHLGKSDMGSQALEDDLESENSLSVKQEQNREKDRQQRLSKYDFRVSHNLILRNGTRLHVLGKGIEGGKLIGESAVLGKCQVSLEQLSSLVYLPPLPLAETDSLASSAFEGWQFIDAPEPRIQREDGAPESPLIGKSAPKFDLTRLDGKTFSLSKQKGKIVVLEFWATWNRDCVKMMPEVEAAVAAFPPGSVVHLAINQGESPVMVNQFLEGRKWQSKPVAIDTNQKIARLFEVDRVPYIVVIRPDRQISWIHSGPSENMAETLLRAITAAGREKQTP